MKIYILLLALVFGAVHANINAQNNTRNPRAERVDKSAKIIEEQKAAKVDSLIPKGKRVRIKPEKNKLYMDFLKQYEARIQLEYIEGVYIPRDLLDCFRQLDTLMEEDVRELFLSFSDEEVDKRTHASLGKWIEHKWSLREGSRLSAYFNKMGVPHPDYMVGIIITSYHRHLNKRDLKVKEQLEYFQGLWQEKQRKEAARLLQATEEAQKQK